MLSLLYTLLKYTLKYKPAKENVEDVNSVIARIESIYETNTSIVKNDSAKENEHSYKTGNVTFIAADYVLIDNHYICDIICVSANDLKVGDKVYYETYSRDQENGHKIKKIIAVIDESWDDTFDDAEKNSVTPQTLQKNMIGKVIDRKNRCIYVEPNNISVDLNKVQSEFVPVIGDWVKLELIVEVEENCIDTSDKIVEISKIQPLRSKLIIGTISSYDPVKECGIIEKNVVFHKGTCDSGYIPSIGDKVISDNIECDQGIYVWRSLTVAPIIQVSDKRIPLPSLCDLHITKEKFNDLIENKCGIIITDNLNINLNVQEEKMITVEIKNTGNTLHTLQKGCFTTKKAMSQLSLVQPTTPDTAMILKPHDTVSFVFQCKAKFVGTSEELFIFNFQGFEIGRLFSITVNALNTSTKPICNNDNTRHRRCFYQPNLEESDQMKYIPGVRPYNSVPFIKVRNIVFKVPQYYWNLVLRCINEKKSQNECERDIGNAIPCLLNRLSYQSYKDRFNSLLYLEEIAQTIDMQQYDMESVTMTHNREYLVMHVPGLSEKRPSLLIGDRAIVSFKWDYSQGKVKYEGYIHKVTKSEIFLKFNQQFQQQYNNEDCQVTFKCSQSAIQRCHNAINMCVNRLESNFLFPTHVIEKDSQINLEEVKIEDESKDVQDNSLINHHNESLSSESSCSSTMSNKSSGSSTRISVVERLFNVKPIDHNGSTNFTATTNDNQHIKKKEQNNSFRVPSLENSNVTSPNNHDNIKLEPYVSQIKRRKLVWFNNSLNCYQKEAVKNILKGEARPLPYIIFGPPGTGKTVTLCETILQIVTMIPESRLLIATPSNSSANLIAERLLDSGILKPGDMVRLIAHHYLGNDSIPERLIPYCATAELAQEGTYERIKHSGTGPKINCSMSVLGRHRITIGTCIALGILHNIGFPRGHFSHVLVDEAGQATEPEIMIPLNFIHTDYGQVVLAGDPLQLGPVVQSRIAKSFGLAESFLTRLLRHFPYQKDPIGFKTQYDPRLVTKLVMNYRSLPQILELSSSLFYDSELQAQISPEDSEEAKLLEKLSMILFEKNESQPGIIFHGINGENCRDVDSPSWYNPAEATQVYLYLLKLYECGLSADDIGVITPYQKQVFQIRELLLELDIKLPKIGSVEGFQGQERKVIIISAVRSCDTFVNEDIKHFLGFVACPERLNVAITRARALLIILGNPKLLAQDPYWRSVVIHCINRNAYTGCPFFLSDLKDGQIDAEDYFYHQ